MLKGDVTTALNEPYSIVLTETSAKKLFGNADALGKTVHMNDVDYEVTGILKDIPFFSHIQFESVVSLSTVEPKIAKDQSLNKWENVYQKNFIYLLLPENSSVSAIQSRINSICAEESKLNDDAEIHVTLQPLYDIMLGEELQNAMKPALRQSSCGLLVDWRWW